jgi:CheY-like chemotaxis protein
VSTNKTILILDDDEITLLILQNALEMEGYKVIACSDSLVVTELLNQHKPDVLVLDVFMPGKDGFEVIKEIRTLYADTFIIAISANDKYLAAIKALGADVALSKINMPDAVIDSIQKFLK